MKKSERFEFDSEPMSESDGQFDVLVIDRTIRVSKSNPKDKGWNRIARPSFQQKSRRGSRDENMSNILVKMVSKSGQVGYTLNSQLSISWIEAAMDRYYDDNQPLSEYTKGREITMSLIEVPAGFNPEDTGGVWGTPE